jgi:AcrR family transcriptional regulator
MGRKKLIADDLLMKIARDVFIRSGLKASTREIARLAGISEAAIFKRYRTKACLFLAAMVPPAADLDALFRRTQQGKPAQREIESVFLRMVEYFRSATPVILQLTLHPSFRFERFAEDHPENPLVAMRSSLMRFLESLRKEGGIRNVNPAPAAFLLFGTAQSVALYERIGAHGGQMPEWLIRAMAQSLWTGMSPDAE